MNQVERSAGNLIIAQSESLNIGQRLIHQGILSIVVAQREGAEGRRQMSSLQDNRRLLRAERIPNVGLDDFRVQVVLGIVRIVVKIRCSTNLNCCVSEPVGPELYG